MDVGTLRVTRGQVKAKSTRMSTFLAELQTNPNKIKQLADRLNRYQEVFGEFNEVQTKIEELDPAERNGNERTAFEDTFFEIVATCNELLQPKEESIEVSPANSRAGSISTRSNDKLPAIALPNFNGEYTKWLSFRDLFESMIHNSEQLDNVRKLHYLKASLKGNAVTIIGALPTASINYEIAWNMIKERFENNKVLIKTHVDNILDLPNIQRESAKALRELSDDLLRNVRALKSLDKPTEEWSTLLVQIVVRKLDEATRCAWEMKNPSKEEPTFQALEEFLRERAQVLETMDQKPEGAKQKRYTKSFVVGKVQCQDCSKNHRIITCEVFLAKSSLERLARVKQVRLCINCLQSGHRVPDCKSSNCRKCYKRHHTLLHFGTCKDAETAATGVTKVGQPSTETSNSETTITAASGIVNSQNTLLSTAIVQVKASNGRMPEARALLDSGSQASFITEKLHRKLQVITHNEEITIIGIGGSCKKLNMAAALLLKSMHNNLAFEVNCFVIPQITTNLPISTFNPQELRIPTNVHLADPRFYESQDVDILLGADVFYNLLSIGHIKLGLKLPTLQKTTLGWVISGKIHSTASSNVAHCHFSQSLEEQLTKFWELEDIQPEVTMAKEEALCEEQFLNSVTRTETERFMVSLPFKAEPISFGNSNDVAQKRLIAMEGKFMNNTELQRQYSAFLKEYEDLAHMSKLENEDTTQGYFLSHHGVTNDTSLTTKLRVVFDASAVTSCGTSLNELQCAGAQQQEDLLSIILRFRMYEYVLTADITKMYRQILISPEHRKYQKILWRSSPEQDPSVYQLNTVTYGMKASSFLAIRCLQELANEFRTEYPTAAKTVESDFYVDDLITGSNSLESLMQLKKEIEMVLKEGCFELRKWSSNNDSLLKSKDTSKSPYQINPAAAQKTLGLIWTPVADVLQCITHSADLDSHKPVAKRTILSSTAQIFDPLGLVSPVIVIAKLILQSLWQLHLPWDASVPAELYTKWTALYKGLNKLEDLAVPRLVICSQATSICLHGFADALERAYGACIYLQSVDVAGNTQVSLVCSRSRVAPLKQVSLPRLELCAAVLLVDIYKKFRDSIRFELNNCTFWSDSTTTLAYPRYGNCAEPKRWKTFVCNRVSKIQRYTNASEWNHVSSGDNPADLISRGIAPQELLTSQLWLHGPRWLQEKSELWPTNSSRDEESIPEERPPKLSFIATSTNKEI